MFILLVTGFKEFKCDNLLVSVTGNNEINIILNKIAFLKDDRVNLSDLAACFDVNNEFFIVLCTVK